MKTFYSLTVLFLLCIIGEAGAQQWLNLYNGASNGNDASNAVVLDGAGNSYYTGYSTGTGTMRDITTLKYNSRGQLLWSETFNGPGNSEDEAYAITIDSYNGIYVAGYSTGINSGRDMTVIKYSNSGEMLWARTYNGSGNGEDAAYAITVDQTGDVVVTGTSTSDYYGSQVTVIKYSPSGDQQWVYVYNAEEGPGGDAAYAITVDAENNIYVTGSSEKTLSDLPSGSDMVTQKLNSDGTSLWVKAYDGASMSDVAYAIAIDPNDNVFITGYTTSATGKDYTTIKYDENGDRKWVNTYNNTLSNRDDVPADLIVDTEGNVIVTGSSMNSSSEDYLTVKYKNSNGSEMFASRYNDASNNKDIAYSLCSNNGRYYIAGSSQSSAGSSSEDIVVIEYSKTGVILGKYKVSNPGIDELKDIVVSRTNDISIAGSLRGAESQDMGAGRFTGSAFDNNSEFVTLNVTHIYNMSVANNITSEIPASYRLYQNYPNPFNPSTSIKFDISSSSLVKLSVFDALGREVSVPVNGYLNAGSYEISLNMSELTTGVYFYKLTSGSYSDIKKMIMIK